MPGSEDAKKDADRIMSAVDRVIIRMMVGAMLTGLGLVGIAMAIHFLAKLVMA